MTQHTQPISERKRHALAEAKDDTFPNLGPRARTKTLRRWSVGEDNCVTQHQSNREVVRFCRKGRGYPTKELAGGEVTEARRSLCVLCAGGPFAQSVEERETSWEQRRHFTCSPRCDQPELWVTLRRAMGVAFIRRI